MSGAARIAQLSRQSDSAVWGERSGYWLKKSVLKATRRNPRPPLILSGHGVSLRVEKGALLVRNGFTHFPQRQEIWRLFSGSWRLPSRIIVLDVDGSLSFDALAWLSEHDIPLIQINWRGDVVNVVGSRTSVEIPERVKSQLATRAKEGGLKLALRLIEGKIANGIETLRRAFPRSRSIDVAINKLELEKHRLRHKPPSTVSQLMGVEGRVGYAYFDAWRTCPIKWKGIDRYPIPEDWRQIGRRSSKLGNKFHPNRNATHPINAMLNYAYAILESQVRMQVVAAGLDPTIGILHGSYGAKHGFVYDLMEPLRPVVDGGVLDFVQARTFHPADFTIRSDGVCRLNPEMARSVVRAVASTKEIQLRNLLTSN